jgi:two-component sensor histidine kinase
VPDLERRFASVRAGQRLDHYEMVQRRRDGTTFEASVTMSPILDHNKQVIGISQVLRDTTEQKRSRTLLEQSLREKEVLLREIHHRVKNNLQVISSLLNLQVASVSSEAARKGLVESQSRIQSMALLHQLLYQSKDLARIDLGDYLRALVDYLVGTYAADSLRIETTLVAPHVRLDLDRSIPCGLIVNELVTNAFRHAFPAGRSGHIVVELTEQGGGRLALEVRDDGVGMPAGVDLEHGQTFGLQIARLLAMQLDGDMKIRSDHHGTSVRVTFPMHARREPAPELQGAAAAP